MVDNVFILGAGASADAGAPIMREFIRKAEDLLEQQGSLSSDTGEQHGKFRTDIAKDFKKVFDLRSALRRIYANSELDIENIEELFGLIEMAKMLHSLGEYDNKQIGELRAALITLIVKTIEHSVEFPIRDGEIAPSETYSQLIQKLQSTKLNESGFITFNYDIALEYALAYKSEKGIDYCLKDIASGGIEVMKLHGSINWATIEGIDEIFPYDISTYLSKNRPLSIKSPKKYRAFISDKLSDTVKDRANPVYKNVMPLIVPPTWNKTDYSGQLLKVWRRAANLMSQAKFIYIIGYSFPESDSFFKYLFASSLMDNSRIRKLKVIDIAEKGGLVDTRYKKLLGSSLRGKYEYFSSSFRDAI